MTSQLPDHFVPWEQGNRFTLRHGAYSTVALGARVDELANEIRPFVRAYQPEDELAVKALALALARIEAAAGALAAAEPGDLARLEQDMRGWTNTKLKLLTELGLTPLARRRLGLAVGGGAPSAPDVTELPDEDLDESEGTAT